MTFPVLRPAALASLPGAGSHESFRLRPLGTIALDLQGDPKVPLITSCGTGAKRKRASGTRPSSTNQGRSHR